MVLCKSFTVILRGPRFLNEQKVYACIPDVLSYDVVRGTPLAKVYVEKRDCRSNAYPGMVVVP